MADKTTRDPTRPEGRGAVASSEKLGQGDAYGGNPPDLDEDQNPREAGMYDIADAAQNQTPGRPQNVTIGRGRAPRTAEDVPTGERTDKPAKR